jgi:hypothetical protein
MKKANEYENFDRTMRELLKVSHAERYRSRQIFLQRIPIVGLPSFRQVLP